MRSRVAWCVAVLVLGGCGSDRREAEPDQAGDHLRREFAAATAAREEAARAQAAAAVATADIDAKIDADRDRLAELGAAREGLLERAPSSAAERAQAQKELATIDAEIKSLRAAIERRRAVLKPRCPPDQPLC